MNSPEDSSSSSTQKTSNWTDHQTSTPQPGLSPASPVQTPVSTNPASLSQSLISPQKQSTAEKGTSDASQPHSERRKRGRPPKHKKPHAVPEHQIQSTSDSDPCSQREDQMNAFTVTQPLSSISPVPEDRCQPPDAQTEVETQPLSPSPPVGASELPSPTKDLQKVQHNEGTHLSSPSVEQGDTTSPNVLTAGEHTDSLTSELGAEPLVSPQKQRTAEKGTSDASQPQGVKRKRGRPPKHKKPHTVPEHQIHQAHSPTDTHPCSQPEDQTEAETQSLTPNSPVPGPEDRCLSPVRKRKYTKKSETLKVDQSQETDHSQEGSATKRKKESKISLTNKLDQSQGTDPSQETYQSKESDKSQETVRKWKHTRKSQSHKVDRSQETGRNREKTSEKSQKRKVESQVETEQSQVETDQSQVETVKNRKYTKKSQSRNVVSDVPISLSVLSADLSPSLSSSTHIPPGVPKRKYKKKSQTHREDSEILSSLPVQSAELSSGLQSNLSPTLSTPGVSSSPSTPKRVRGRTMWVQQQICLSSTPGPRSSIGTDNPFSASLSPLALGSKPDSLQNASPIPPWKLLEHLDMTPEPDVALPGSKPWRKPRGRPRKNPAVVKSVKNPAVVKSVKNPAVVKSVKNPAVVKRVKDPAVVKRVKDPAVVKRVKDPAVVKRVKDLAVVKRVKDPAVVKRVKDPAVVKRVKDPAVVKRVKDPAVVKRVKDPAVVKRVKDPAVVKRVKDPAVVKRVKDPAVVKRVKDPAVVKRVKNPAVVKRVKNPAVVKRVKNPAVVKRVKNSAVVKRVKTQCGKKKNVKTAAERGSQTCSSEEGPPAKRRRRSRKGLTAEGVEGVGLQSDNSTSSQPIQCSRPRFELLELDSPDEDTGDSSLSSDLSIELSLQEDHLTSLPLEEEEEEQEDEEDLPSFLNNTKPLSITEGICVWCKFRNYPFWPAMVKSVNRKMKKASIVFIDDLLFDKKRIRKGFSVALKTLKPFDCEEADQLVCKARESYDAAIKWCLELIADYRIRIGCGFTGSFIEYFSDDISCPVRKRYPQGTSDLTFPSKLILESQFLTSNLGEEEEEGSDRQEEERRRRRKLLPDRSKAARNRANEKLVDFIVKQRRVETRLLGVISGQQQSKWLRWFLAASRSVVDTYLEDEEQLDQVYQYLRGVYETAPLTAPCLADVDRIRLVLDVLLPEAIIYAIAGVDKLSLVKAEDKYLKGPCLSKREREEFDWMIEQQMKMRASIGQRPAN